MIFAGAFALLAVGIWGGRKSRSSEISQLKNSVSHKEYKFAQLKDQAESVIQKMRQEEVAQQNRLQQQNASLAQIKSELAASQNREANSNETNRKLLQFQHETLDRLRKEAATLPSAVRWADHLQASLDELIVNQLESPPHPARAAAAQVREARAIARSYKQEAELLRNRVELYETQAPWLIEYAEYSIEEIIAGLQEEEEIRRTFAAGEDPVRLFLTHEEWTRLTATQRNQLSLDRYWEASRKRSAWTAGIQYERYVGYLYEKAEFAVENHGALKGKEDLGIDLICKKGDTTYVIQCKRLSPAKEIPVRENVVAQIYGAAMFLALRTGMGAQAIKPVIVTTYQLSEQARQFAGILGVEVRENEPLRQYPCIKCNISERSGEKIYHLPFDQQYDSAKIGNVKGEFYALTVAEAENAGFRRALHWSGST